MRRSAVAAIVLAALPIAAFSSTAPQTAAAVLARVRAATLFRPLSTVRSVRTTGNLVAVGLRAPYTEIDDVAGERFVQHAGGANFLSGTQGFTGTVSWSQDRSGIVRVDGGESTRLQNVDQAYMDAFAYLRPGMGGASATFVGERHDGSKVYDVLEITPAGGSAMTVWVDEATHLIAKLQSTIGIVSSTTTYADYRRVSGVEIPFRVASMDSQGNGSQATVTSVALNVGGVDAAMRIPRSDAHDFSIFGGTSTTVPISIINNHIYLHVMLDGKGPFTFVFDTGGANLITPAVAAALHARSTGGANIAGTGNATEGAQFAHVASMQVGNATIRDQDFAVLPIQTGFGIAEGVHIDGMFGPSVPDRFLTRIDYAQGRMTLSLYGSTTPQGRPVPFYFDGTLPEVPVTIGGVATHADLDTGNRGQLYLTTPFVAGHPKIAAFAKTANAVTGFGVGGPSYGRLGRIPTVQIGPFVLHGLVTDFGTQHAGATADPFDPANLGTGAWNRFVLTLDYPQQRIYLEPNARYGTPFTYDRSGLFLIQYRGAITVLDSLAGTPASAAGLKKGDVIVTVDGRSAASYTLAQMRGLFAGAPGTTLHLVVRAGSQERDVTLTLANYV